HNKLDLVALRERKMEGVLLRSRARWIAEGEKITKYFCELEKRNYVSKQMIKLTANNGEEIHEVKDIIKEVKTFYERLYSDRQVEECEISDLVGDIPTLTLQEKTSLEGKITLDEASAALKNMKNNKSPGSDGFTVEFFKFFWLQWGAFIVNSLNDGFRKGELSSTQKEGVIICIPKGNKDKQLLKNWRPISLLNVVYKIGSACIANRLKVVLPTLINEDQTGFMANRFIGDNIRLIHDLISYLHRTKLPGLLLCLDF
ncbi:reverse transcriptase domain-containing protein, partial [Thiolapillus sp.]|uniref:reverse transcriptase domain-containing protein n=1 Tax=Thiolapillus sp. TaxID=2017437 RepID=UPI003AF9AE09